ncbi:peptidoglycan D,D-transpeptidase FtsI family protein [Candidatus Marinarcus aquaticus]|uniref:Cell division protein FtsW n=1 Tax=Candidatus Marinarcus aquaticus TaxID=2044504 RepID=A0A4Q0XR59_9BACT|nr:penicillin-binding protein 2 [Candidatus Marinarcus aquaticus]RXJ56168.1 cell division protein FtsW [Candidatus Marinarcus aquaticus]
MSSNQTNNLENITKTKKIAILFFFLIFLLVLLIISVFNSTKKQRRLPSLETTKKELAVRGDIISSDNFKIASSKKLYKASIDTRFLNEDKKELFINLFSIYSDIPKAKIKKKVYDSLKHPGSLVLSYNIDSRSAKNLKELSYKLRRLDVFKAIKINGNKILQGLDIIESGEKRINSYQNSLTPVVGYIRKYESNNEKTRVTGIKGLESSYNAILNSSKDGILKGERDVLSYISFNKNSIIKNREDGASIVLNIPLKLQKTIEMQLDYYKEKFTADEIMVSIMESDTGKILSLATSNRFNPEDIKKEEIPYLKVNAVEYAFEPGSIIKPVALAMVLDKDRAKKNELLFAFNKGSKNSKGEFPRGRYKLGRYSIKDDHRFTKNYLTLDDVIVYSSNIGILQLVQRLSGEEFSDGMKSFGFTEKTGIDLTNEKTGYIPEVYKFKAGEDKQEDNVFKATVSYGQGMTSTFMQAIRAYSVFNNQGNMTTPKLVSHVLTSDNEKLFFNPQPTKRVISEKTAKTIKRMLIQTVKEGTGENAAVAGLEIGGKTGTAQIADKGRYQKKYISSFFGFANDKEHKYTIGVTVVNPSASGKYWYYLYASQSAVPVFKKVIESLVKLDYLKPQLDEHQ